MKCRFCTNQGKHLPDKICAECRAAGCTKADWQPPSYFVEEFVGNSEMDKKIVEAFVETIQAFGFHRFRKSYSVDYVPTDLNAGTDKDPLIVKVPRVTHRVKFLVAEQDRQKATDIVKDFRSEQKKLASKIKTAAGKLAKEKKARQKAKSESK